MSGIAEKLQNTKLSFLFGPDKYFESKAKEPIRLGIPFLVMLVVGAFTAFNAGFAGARVLPTVLNLTSNAAMALGIGVSFAVVLLGWFIISLIVYLLGGIFKKAEEGFSRTAEFLAYGSIPLIFAYIINTPLFYFLIDSIDFTVISTYIEENQISFGEPGTLLPNLGQVFDALRPVLGDIAMEILGNPLTSLIVMIAVMFLLWSSYIWVYGIKYGRNLTVEQMILIFLIVSAIVTLVVGISIVIITAVT